MPREGHEKALLFDRCWSIYLLLTETFPVPSTFHSEFPPLVERVLVSRLFHLVLRLADQHTLYLREEYDATEHHLEIRNYSYTLAGPAGVPLLRADRLPYHRTDFKKHPLAAFPHHLHDDKGHIQSFSGHLNDFIALVKRQVAEPN